MKIVTFKGDVGILRPLCEAWRDESGKGFENFAFCLDIDKFLSYLEFVKKLSVLLVGFENDEPIGFMGLFIQDSPLGADVILNENFWYIDKAHRGMAGVRMLKAAERTGREKGCNKFSVTASYLANEAATRVESLYKAMGFRLFEKIYIKGLL